MTNICRAGINTAPSVFVALLLSVASATANAVLVTIDPNQSYVTYNPGGVVICDPSGNCGSLPPPQTFSLSGSFEVVQETVFITTSFVPLDGYEREQVRFGNVAIDSGAAADLGFTFPTYFAVMEGNSFAGSEDACSWFPSTGSCSSLGWFGGYSGTFDGHTLAMSGTDYTDVSFFADTFNFTLVAQAVESAAVPEPGVLACLALAGLALGAARRRSTQVVG